MKKATFLLAAALLMGFATTAKAESNTEAEAAKFEKATLVPVRTVLNEVMGNVDVKLQAQLPKKAIGNKERYILTPVLYNPATGQGRALTSIIIDGKKFSKIEGKAEKEIKDSKNFTHFINPVPAVRYANQKEERVINYEDRIRFEPWMEKSELIVVQKLVKKKKMHIIAEDLYAQGVVYIKPVVVKEPETYTTIEKDKGAIEVFFEINSAKLDPNFGKNPAALNNLKGVVSKVFKSKDVTVEGMTINGTASPDGNQTANEKLAKDRAQAIKDYVTNDLKMPVADVNRIKVTSSTDWAGLRTLVQNSSSISNKDAAYKAIDAKDQKALRALADWGYIKNSLLPQLRQATYEVNYNTTVTRTR